MNIQSNIFTRILLAFGLFSMGLALIMGFAAYFTARDLGDDFLEKRTSLVLQTLVEAESHIRSDNETMLDTKKFVAGMNLDFLVGKQLPPNWELLPDGMHFLKDSDRFVLLKRISGIPYALCGPIQSRKVIFAKICSIFLICGSIGLIAAIIMAIFLASRLARPLQILSLALNNTDTNTIPAIPRAITERQDEIGVLARTILSCQLNTLKALEREKSFTSAASHELRTPLTILSGGLEIVENQSANNQKALQTIRRLIRTTDNMSLTVSTLLSLARGERRKLELIDLSKVILRVLSEFTQEKADLQNARDLPQEILTAAGIKVFIRGGKQFAPGEMDLACVTLRNLMENACKHGNGKEIRIDILPNSLVIRNTCNLNSEISTDSGFGLLIAKRACERMKWNINHTTTDTETIFRINF